MSEKILTVEFVTPEKRVWSGKATMVSARTLEGDLGILPDHAPLLGVLVDGKVTIDGIDLVDANTTTTAAALMEYGYGLFKGYSTTPATATTTKIEIIFFICLMLHSI